MDLSHSQVPRHRGKPNLRHAHRRITYKHSRSPPGCVLAGIPHSGALQLPACRHTARMHGRSHCGQSLGGCNHTSGSCRLPLEGHHDSQQSTYGKEDGKAPDRAVCTNQAHPPALTRDNHSFFCQTKKRNTLTLESRYGIAMGLPICANTHICSDSQITLIRIHHMLYKERGVPICLLVTGQQQHTFHSAVPRSPGGRHCTGSHCHLPRHKWG